MNQLVIDDRQYPPTCLKHRCKLAMSMYSFGWYCEKCVMEDKKEGEQSGNNS